MRRFLSTGVSAEMYGAQGGCGSSASGSSCSWVTGTITAENSALSAQLDAVPFYEAYGFRSEGDEYEDAGIPHHWMTCPLDETLD